MISLAVYLLLILLMMALNAFFCASEISFMSASKIYLQGLADAGNRKARCFSNGSRAIAGRGATIWPTPPITPPSR